LWAVSAGGSSDDFTNSVTVDGTGNVYVSGFFKSDTCAFGSVMLTDNNTGWDMFIAKLSGTTDIAEENLPSPHFYPNPGNGKFYLRNALTANYRVRIYSAQGKCVMDEELKAGEIDLSTQPKGIYFLRATDGRQHEYGARLIVE
jgi:hypothetical protein